MNTPNEHRNAALGCLKKLMGDSCEYESHIQNLFELASRRLGSFSPKNMLDLGCADGSRTLRVAEHFMIPPAHAYGLDFKQANIDHCRKLFNAELVNLEFDSLPYQDETFDIVVCNQVFEHLKNYHDALQQVIRVTRPGGYIMIGIPNLAHLINRCYLLFGIQPMCIDINSSHVRGFTHIAFK